MRCVCEERRTADKRNYATRFGSFHTIRLPLKAKMEVIHYLTVVCWLGRSQEKRNGGGGDVAESDFGKSA